MRFVALDVETANADMASICSIGIATYEGRRLIDEFYTLIDPDDDFDPMNISIHGIDFEAVQNAPSFAEASREILPRINGSVVVTHTHFDRVAVAKASQKSGVEFPTCRWLDSSRVARRTWEDCARSGYGLRNLCDRIGYTFQHHNALEDAKAAGQILLVAIAESGFDLEQTFERATQPISPKARSAGRTRVEGNRDGPLFGEVVVFTGSLDLPREDAATLAAQLGCDVAPNVTKTTTLLVVGDTDIRRLAGHEKSMKHRKAEQLISAGISIRIITESGFRHLVASV